VHRGIETVFGHSATQFGAMMQTSCPPDPWIAAQRRRARGRCCGPAEHPTPRTTRPGDEAGVETRVPHRRAKTEGRSTRDRIIRHRGYAAKPQDYTGLAWKTTGTGGNCT
jgi:hypothetical protein